MLMFGSFNTWRSHEMDHRREWFCPLCNLSHHDKSKARMHLIRDHGELAGNQVNSDLLLQASSRPSEQLPVGDCPFCDWGIILRERNYTPQEHDLTVPSRRFMKHLGKHLEEIALFVIPQPQEEHRSSGDTASNAVHAALDEDSATGSTLSSFPSQPSFGAPAPAEPGQEPPSNEDNRGLCPFPTCGRHFKDLKSHMLTHQNERPEKCPIPSCDYHTKGFARTHDNNRHVLTHYKGKLVCGFCPGSGSATEKSFNRADVFKRHLTSVHGVEQAHQIARRRYKHLSHNVVCDVAGTCSTCSVVFANAQTFYEHLDDCVLRVIQQAHPPEAHQKPPETSERHAEFAPKYPKYFSAGRVFDVLWTKQVAQDTWFDHNVNKEATSRSLGSDTNHDVRRFVVVKEGTHHCTALPISVHAGVADSGVLETRHAIIFTGQDFSPPSDNEVPSTGESPMRPVPIRVVLDDASEINQMSRIDLGGIHLFQHNVGTKSVGQIHQDSLKHLMQQFYDVSNAPGAEHIRTRRPDVASELVEDEHEHEDKIEDESKFIDVSESESGGEDDDSDGDSQEYDSGRESQGWHDDENEGEIPHDDSNSESQEDESESESHDDESEGEIQDIDN
jgi:hypothetical protein